MKYKLDEAPFDRVMFTNLNRTLKPGITVLVGCNGYGKTTILRYLKSLDCKVFQWSNTDSKRTSREAMLESENYDILAQLAFSSEGEEISTNIGILASRIGSFVRKIDKDVLVLLDGVDSGSSIDNIVEIKEFFHNTLIPDVEKHGHKCYIVMTANEYEVTKGERCVDARSGEERSFPTYEDYREYIMETRRIKNESY